MKEAFAIIESVRHWKHYFTGRYFKLITGQKNYKSHSLNIVQQEKLHGMHASLCHLGNISMACFVQVRILQYTMREFKEVPVQDMC